MPVAALAAVWPPRFISFATEKCARLWFSCAPGRDSPMLTEIMASLSVDRIGPGRARTRPDRVLADKAYSAKAHRAMLRKRNIQVVISERYDQIRSAGSID